MANDGDKRYFEPEFEAYQDSLRRDKDIQQTNPLIENLLQVENYVSPADQWIDENIPGPRDLKPLLMHLLNMGKQGMTDARSRIGQMGSDAYSSYQQNMPQTMKDSLSQVLDDMGAFGKGVKEGYQEDPTSFLNAILHNLSPGGQGFKQFGIGFQDVPQKPIPKQWQRYNN